MGEREYEPLAEIEVDTVRPGQHGFTLRGEGEDRAEYQLELRFEMPLDAQTRTVLAELLSHSGLAIARRARVPPRSAPLPRR
jgi:hypothetical protein